MALLADYLKEERHTLTDNQIELHTIGAIDKLPLAVRLVLGAVKEATKGLQGMRLTLALSYGARDELLRAIRGVVTELGPTRNAGAIDEAMLERHLDTAGMPDPDLLIRTSGEMRISNFMLWQLAYTELYVTDVAWPDFTPAHLQAAFDAFAQRQRRFGKTAAQLKTTTGGRST